MKSLVLVGRLIFGTWMLINGANHFFLSLWPAPTGHEPLAMQLMAALLHSGLYDVVMAIQLLTGALILTGFLVPVALCIVMPVSTCALYWALILDHRVLGAAVALAAFALNGLLMLAYVEYYRGALQRYALAAGESTSLSFDSLFVNAGGRTARGPFVAALATLLAVVILYAVLVTGRNAEWCLLVLLFPGGVLHARRLRDMGQSVWLLIVPEGLLLAAFAIWLKLASFGARLDAVLPLVALAVAAAFALWACVARGAPSADRTVQFS